MKSHPEKSATLNVNLFTNSRQLTGFSNEVVETSHLQRVCRKLGVRLQSINSSGPFISTEPFASRKHYKLPQLKRKLSLSRRRKSSFVAMMAHPFQYSKWVSKLSTILFVTVMCWFLLYFIAPMKKTLLSEKQTNKSIELLKGYYEHKMYSNAKTF